MFFSMPVRKMHLFEAGWVYKRRKITVDALRILCANTSNILVHQTFPFITSVFTLESRSHHFSSILSYIIKSFPPLLFLELRKTFLSGWSHLFSFILPMFSIRGYQKPILPLCALNSSFSHLLLYIQPLPLTFKHVHVSFILQRNAHSNFFLNCSWASLLPFTDKLLENVSSPTDFIFSPASLSTHSNTTSIPTTQQNVTLQGHQYFHFDKCHGYLGVTFSTIYLFHSQISFSLFGFLCFPKDLSCLTFLNCPSLSWPLMYFLRQLIRLSFLLPHNSP